ncbi:hypothetical protein GCM10007973_02600 [Polymorphobacter multimanifer]|uniref:peptidoglycan endopeptidase n=1 Tax=Polymorphobacter multimanifer TaxID=1070431 RepID=UPI0019C5426B|nr:peptidoglycan endopeptidase [Polymorphobacter multimanifer]GGI69002.1 hypothetical protein GCM10007973_02600 [Polymorphobacter multimanifer]
MTLAADAVVAAARLCLGPAFRPQGRVPGLGLDCVGVVLAAAAALGLRPEVPAYRLGGDHAGLAETVIAAAGARRIRTAHPGDIVLMAPRVRLRHLGILVAGGRVHAHAGVGRVIEGPVDPAWQWLGAWRLPGVD